MRTLRRVLLGGGVLVPLVLGTVLLVAGQSAGEREVVSTEVSVSGTETALRLEFMDGHTVEVAFRDGRVLIDGREAGTFSRGDALDTSWRSLLGRAVALDNGEVTTLLREWSPPPGLTGEAAQIAADLDRTLDESLRPPSLPIQPEPPAVGSIPALEGAPLAALLGRAERLPDLARALQDLTLREVTVRVGADVSVEEDETIEGTLIAVDGDVDVRGEITGNLVLVGGDLRLHPEGRIGGDVRLTDGQVRLREGLIAGSLSQLQAVRESMAEVRQEIRDEVRAEVSREARSAASRVTNARANRSWNPFRHIGRGVAGIFQTVVAFGILAGLGLVLRHFFPRHLDVVSRTARNATGRSAAVGLAGLFLAFPAWVVGIVVLAVSIVGIPLILAWLPLFPIVVAAGAMLGFLAVAGRVGEWVARQRFPGLEWARPSNEVHTLVLGVGALLAGVLAANVVRMAGPWLGFLRVLLQLVATLGIGAVLVTGFGAVLLSRGGRDAALAGGMGAWEEPIPEPEPDLGEEP